MAFTRFNYDDCRTAKLLEESTHFQTYREETRNNFIFTEDNIIPIRNQLKDREIFYKNQGVIHWSKNNNSIPFTFKVFFIIVLFKIINNIYSKAKREKRKNNV